jgi:hypothetical protein
VTNVLICVFLGLIAFSLLGIRRALHRIAHINALYYLETMDNGERGSPPPPQPSKPAKPTRLMGGE